MTEQKWQDNSENRAIARLEEMATKWNYADHRNDLEAAVALFRASVIVRDACQRRLRENDEKIVELRAALKLPPKDRPLRFRISSALYHAVFEAVGEASICWNPRPNTEVFDSEHAS